MTFPSARESPPDSVLITANFSNRTGFAWTAFYRLFNHLAHDLVDAGLGIVLSFARVEPPVEVLDPDVPHSVFEFNPRTPGFHDLLELRKNIKERRIRYAYLTDLPSWHWQYAFMRGWGVRSIIAHQHISVANPFPPSPETGIRRLVKSRINRSRWLAADHILVCSEFVKTRLTRKAVYPAEKSTVLHYGLPEERFGNAPSGPDVGGPVRIFCAGRATAEKGIQHLIEATARLRTQPGTERFEVVYAGDGPELDAFKECAVDAGVRDQFQFLGYITDTTSELRKADIVVIPSVWGDAFPYTVLEAMAAGKAIVATKAGGIPEQLGSPPRGLLVPPGDSQALATVLAKLLADPSLRARLAAEAYDRARECFREEDYFRRVSAEVRGVFDAATSS